MKKVFSVDITSWTASFRCPALVSGDQLTTEVPPVSTVIGLINAAAGRFIPVDGLEIGYYFQFHSKAVDIETIHMREVNSRNKLSNVTRTNAINREFMYDNFLRLYVTDETIIDYLRHPVYSVCLGRSQDLATIRIKSIQERELPQIENAPFIRGQLIPFKDNYLPGALYSLPTHTIGTYPIQHAGWQSFSVINHMAQVKSRLTAYRDEINGKPVDIYFHKLSAIEM